MAKLVIVESPAKAKTIGKYLGDDYEVTASMGHIRDLPASQLGIDVEHGYAPQYISIKGKEKLIKELKSKESLTLVSTRHFVRDLACIFQRYIFIGRCHAFLHRKRRQLFPLICRILKYFNLCLRFGKHFLVFPRFFFCCPHFNFSNPSFKSSSSSLPIFIFPSAP